MFDNDELNDLVSHSATVKSKSFVVAEWNMNDPENIENIGNYRYRWTEPRSNFFNSQSIYDKYDNQNNDCVKYWTNASSSDNLIEGIYDNNDEPTIFLEEDIRYKYLYSLDDCFKPHRPRSGINYPLYFADRYFDGLSSVGRPRYYLAHKDNPFKYHTSYRKVVNTYNDSPTYDIYDQPDSESPCGDEFTGTTGLSFDSNGQNIIWDVSPFVVYKESIPTNKIVVKMQTNIGTVEEQGVTDLYNNPIDDPLYGSENATTPNNWLVQVLKDNTWTTVKEFSENETKSDGTPVVGPDGYVELNYGIKFPERFIMQKRYLGLLSNPTLLPITAAPGDYFYVSANESALGAVYIFNQDLEWEPFIPEFGWVFNEKSQYSYVDGQWVLDQSREYFGEGLVSDLTSPASFTIAGNESFREFEYIRGLRLVVKTMNRSNVTFDLIELSPRLQVDISDRTLSFEINKSTGLVDEMALPIGGLQAGTGSITIFDYDSAFRKENSSSIIKNILNSDLTFTFYDLIEDDLVNYYVPIKKMYSENKAPRQNNVSEISYDLRDAFYLLENQTAASIMLTDVSLSYAVCVLLDLAGFSNYTIKRDTNYSEPVIPYFFVESDKNVAEILNELAVATQSAMFFDEYNNLVIMYKEYLFGNRDADFILDGNSSSANIVDIASSEKKIYNDGVINYTQRYLQRAVSSLSQQSFLSKDKTWQYLPALLWEAPAGEKTVAENTNAGTQSGYTLSAMPLNADLSDAVPVVSNGIIINNVIDVGDNAQWLGRYNGYLYANGEIIKFDAIRYNFIDKDGVGGGVWISSATEYQKYFAQLPFNGKMYPTGLVRIYCEPFYYVDESGVERLQNGAVARHGRGQFGTTITSHSAGLDQYWSDNTHARSIYMNSDYLFDTENAGDLPTTVVGPAGISSKHLSSTRNGVIKNYLLDDPVTESSVSSYTTATGGTMQSSALVFNGPSFSGSEAPIDVVSYVYKELDNSFKHFGTRMRVIGKLEAASSVDQNAIGGMNFFTSTLNNDVLLLNGGSGGLAVGVNPETNVGYYFELIALTNTNLEDVQGSDDGTGIHNIIFYKVVRNSSSTVDSEKAIPVKLWGGLADIIVDSGQMAGAQSRVGEERSTVYDISVEWKDYSVGVGDVTARRFYLYVNGMQVATVDDISPLPMYSNMALYVRGNSKVMFENIFALRSTVANDMTGSVVGDNMITEAFGNLTLDATSFKNKAINGFIQRSYLSGISSTAGPSHNLYYDEFGTIMREAAYFDIKFDKAYPALLSQVSPVLNGMPGYVVSGYETGPYGAKFLIFNVMDSVLVLDETSGNYLRIQGVAFTQDTTHEYKVDDHFNINSSLSDPTFASDNSILRSPTKAAEKYKDIKINRMKYGLSSWSLQSLYIQTQSVAQDIMDWLVDKTTRQRQLVGVEVFANPLIQLGDVAQISYTRDGVEVFAEASKKFIVYNIKYTRDGTGPKMTIYLSEV